jgi:hypothetical protein
MNHHDSAMVMMVVMVMPMRQVLAALQRGEVTGLGGRNAQPNGHGE